MPSSRTNLALAISAAGLLALIPRPWLTPVGYFHNPTTFLLGPVQQPVRSLLVWFRGPAPASVDVGSTPELAQLQTNLQQATLELLQARQEAADLRLLVRDLSRGLELNPELSVRQIPAPVIGFGSDLSGGLLTVRAGTSDGVDANAVVVVRGVHLVGRVQRADSRTCAVLPITDPAFPKMYKNQKFSGVIMLDEQKRGPFWKLDSIENGKLVGKVYFEQGAPGEERPTVANDMLVRLRDDSWPPSAQMLVIGRIVQVETGANERPIVTVEPFQDVSRVSEVMIRVADKTMPPTPPTPPTSAAPGGKTKP
jgi:hypothetical protein